MTDITPFDTQAQAIAAIRQWFESRTDEQQVFRLDDMVFLAHIRSQFTASHETYGSPRIQVELQGNGLAIGRHRVARLMRENGLKGNCYDNAVVETVFKTIKSELIWRTIWQSRSQATTAIGHYIDGFYNPVRRHSALGYKSPCRFEVEAA